MSNFLATNMSAMSDKFLKYGINTPLQIWHFMAQLDHESGGFVRFVENLSYDPQGLLKTFNKQRIRITPAQAQQFGRAGGRKANQEMIGNIVYANMNGNGGVESGDGYKYRGRGLIQLTGKANYQKFAAFSGIDVVNNPELAATPEVAIDIACWFWRYGSSLGDLNKLAERNDIKSITKGINGGDNGITDRVKKFAKYKKSSIISELKKKFLSKFSFDAVAGGNAVNRFISAAVN